MEQVSSQDVMQVKNRVHMTLEQYRCQRPRPAAVMLKIHIKLLTPPKLSCSLISVGDGFQDPADTQIYRYSSPCIKWLRSMHTFGSGTPNCRQKVQVFLGKNMHINGPVLFKLVLFKSHLYLTLNKITLSDTREEDQNGQK